MSVQTLTLTGLYADQGQLRQTCPVRYITLIYYITVIEDMSIYIYK